jgi:hypothetical protein
LTKIQEIVDDYFKKNNTTKLANVRYERVQNICKILFYSMESVKLSYEKYRFSRLYVKYFSINYEILRKVLLVYSWDEQFFRVEISYFGKWNFYLINELTMISKEING